MKLSDNFSISEFACHDGSDTPTSVQNNLLELATNLQALRDALGRPIRIISGYRSPAHNSKVNGAATSQHMLGKAADIKVSDMEPKEVAKTIEALISQGRMKQGGIGIYRNWVHYDIRGTKARWSR